MSAAQIHAHMLADSGQLEPARALFGKVLERSPQEGAALIGRARALVKLQQPQAAIADFKQGLKLLSEPAPEHFVELAQVLASQNQIDQALQSLDWGVKKIGPSLPLQVPAFELELQRHNYDACLSRIGSILERVHRKESWLARRGDVLVAAGRQVEARQSYEASLSTINALPRLVQQGPAMTELRTAVTKALASMTNASMVQN
jgi:predicted negative regulator of RcsB-dependent stress response